MEIVVPAATIVATMLAAWLVSLILSDVSVVDPVWGPAYGVVAVAVLATRGSLRTDEWIVAAVTIIWGLRLGIHLGRRKLAEPGEDRRYVAMRARRPGTFWLYSLGVVFGLQGVLIAVIALPILFLPGAHGGPGLANHGGGAAWLAVPGGLIWLVGFTFEAVGDEQLRRFKADPASTGKVMDRGLWRYTRHPNYFGDACVWWGIWLIALGAGTPWWTAVGPVLMTWLLARGSGKPILERDIAERRPDYAAYIERTSGFVPLPPKASGSVSRAPTLGRSR